MPDGASDALCRVAMFQAPCCVHLREGENLQVKRGMCLGAKAEGSKGEMCAEFTSLE